MMLSRRAARPPTDVVSSCSSSNRRHLDHLQPSLFPYVWQTNPLPMGRSAATGSEGVDADGCCSPRTGGDDDSGNTALLLTNFAGKKRTKKRDKSYGSSGCRRSSGSLTAKRPSTPSPVCSPVSSFSCSPPSEMYYFRASTDASNFTGNQSSGIRRGNKSASPEETGPPRRKEPSKQSSEMGARNDPVELQQEDPRPSVRGKTDTHSSIKTDMPHNSNSKPNTVASSSTYASCDPNCSFRTSSAADSDRKLQIWIEEERRRRDDGYEVDGDDSGGYDNSDTDSTMEEHLGWATRSNCRAFRYFASADGRRNMSSRLKQWKEAKSLELVNKLREKEAEIMAWEKMQTMKARMVMREFDMKLEKRRAKAMEKMQGRILTAQKKAEQKKLKERASASKKMSEVPSSLEGMRGAAGKLPCKLFCLR